MVEVLCWAISSPRSQVSERRNSAGSWPTCWLRTATKVDESLAGVFTKHAEARTTLHQRDHVTVAGPAQQIAFPVTGNGAIFDFGWPFANGDRIDNLAARVPVNTGMARAADPPLGSQMPHQFQFQRSPRL